MIRRPPRSTLFPTRRSSDLATPARGIRGRRPLPGGGASRSDRSEEHTSELQSLTNLVCRLLLEKKKIIQRNISSIRIIQKSRTGAHINHMQLDQGSSQGILH